MIFSKEKEIIISFVKSHLIARKTALVFYKQTNNNEFLEHANFLELQIKKLKQKLCKIK